MGNISRRDFLAVAAVLGAEAAWGRSFSTPSKISWRERRDLFPEGVASGDPDSNSVLLWTRRRRRSLNRPRNLIVEVALDQTFQRVIATQRVSISAEADWTCRVLVGGLKPSRKSIGIALPMRKALAVVWAARSLRRPMMMPARCASPSSVVRTLTRARRTPIDG